MTATHSKSLAEYVEEKQKLIDNPPRTIQEHIDDAIEKEFDKMHPGCNVCGNPRIYKKHPVHGKVCLDCYVKVDRPGPVKNEHRKIHRNEPCPCGSGKKFKNCCYDRL